MDNIPHIWYAEIMNYSDEKKRDGFKGEWIYVLPTESFQDYIQHPQVKRLYLTDVGFFPHAYRHYRERKDGIEEYIFIYCLEGKGTIELLGDRNVTLEKDQAFCIPRFCGHRYYACQDEPWSILWVHFKGDDVNLYPLDERKVVTFSEDSAANRMFFWFQQLLRVLEDTYTLGNFIYLSQVLSLILGETYFRKKRGGESDMNQQITRIVRYMYQNLYKNISLEDITEEFQISRSYLSTIFQKATGRAPMEFYIHLKMKKACKLLRSTELYIYEVGEYLGYQDQYYFSRIFRKVMGVSPKEYRKGEYIPED